MEQNSEELHLMVPIASIAVIDLEIDIEAL
jgi:hypothetical protein